MHKGSGWLFCLLIALGLSFSAFATIYKWVDKNGKVHYTDQPRRGAEVVKPKSNTENSITFITPKVTVPKSLDAAPIEHSVKIISPSDQQTIRDNNGNFTVTASTSTPDRHLRYILLLDGTPVGQPQKAAAFSLQNVDRGEHKLQMVLVKSNNKPVAISPLVTVYVHRASVLLKPKTPNRNTVTQ